MMKWNKIITFLIVTTGTSIVVTNNLFQITEKMIYPIYKGYLITSFLLITLGVIGYSIINMKK